jgi:hypothetical protein
MSDVVGATADDPITGLNGLRTTAAFEGGWSDGSNGNHRAPLNYAEAPWRVGWTDGRVGQPREEHRDLLRIQADYERSQLVLHRTREAEAARAQLAVAQIQEERLRASAEQAGRAFLPVRDDRSSHRGEYSRSIGWLYVVTATVLFLADLPLSFLAADALGISTSIKMGARLVGVDDLRSLRQNWPALWEPLILALGIAALGLFFKVVADFFLSSEAKESKIARMARLLLLVLMVAGMIGTYVKLGALRSEDKLIAAKLKEHKAPALNRLGDLSRDSFIFLAVVLPVIGAFLFAAGTKKVHNSDSFEELKSTVLGTQKELDTALDATSRARGDVAAADAALLFARSEPLISDSLYVMYEHGYNRGYAAPESLFQGASVYERCLANVERWLGIALQHQNEVRSRRA